MICHVCKRVPAIGRSTRCLGCRGLHVVPQGSLVSHTTRFADDLAARMIAARGGATLELCGAALGLTRERVRQIEEAARRKLEPRLRLAGVGAEDVARILATRPGVEVTHGGAGYTGPTRQEMAQPPADGPWSEYGQRVEAAIAALELAAGRALVAAERSAAA